MFACFQRGMFQEVLSLDPDGSADPSDLGPWKDDRTALHSVSQLCQAGQLILHEIQHMYMYVCISLSLKYDSSIYVQ